MPEATAEQQRKLNEQLHITQNLLKDIAKGYNNVVSSTRPVLDGSKEMLKEAQASFDIASQKEGLTKKEAQQLKYTGDRLQMIEETYKHITDNVDGIIAGTAEADPFNLEGQEDMIKNGLGAMTDEIKDSYDYAVRLGKVLSDPKTGKVFGTIDKGADKLESMISSMPGGSFLSDQFNIGGGIKEAAGQMKGNFLKNVSKGQSGFKGLLKGTKLLKIGLIGAALAVASFAMETNKVQKDLGVSYAESAKILGTAKAITAANKLNGMTQEETLGIMKSIASEFGSYSDATAAATLQASNLVANYGMGADSVGILARNMQAVGEGSLDSALNSIELQANMARAADVPVGEVMNDVAKNTELFAKFGKDGGGNITAAAIAAKKLGLELSNVASIADSLLNFEDSIQSQMEAEVLLGKELNLEKAREMVFNNDIAGAMSEISNIMSAQEFESLDAITRASVAKSVGLDVAAFGKAVSGNKGGGITSSMRTGGAPGGGGATSEVENQTKALVESNQQVVRAIQNLEVSG